MEWENWGDAVTVYKLATRIGVSSRNLMNRIVITANKTIIYFKVAKRLDLKCSHQKGMLIM